MTSQTASSLSLCQRHARLRWVGPPLLLSGLTMVGLCIASFLQGGSGYPFFIGLLGMGLGLGSFGANHETAMALALEYTTNDSETPLPKGIADELKEELERDSDATQNLRPFPKTAMILPLIALGVQGLTAWIVLG